VGKSGPGSDLLTYP